jgi:subtilisin family serine protease
MSIRSVALEKIEEMSEAVLNRQTQIPLFLICQVLFFLLMIPDHAVPDPILDVPLTITLYDPTFSLNVADPLMTDVSSMEYFFQKLGAGYALGYTYRPETQQFNLISVDLFHPSPPDFPAIKSRESSEPLPGKPDQSRARPGELLIQFKEHVSLQEMNNLHRTLGSTVIKALPRLGLYRIKFDSRLSRDAVIQDYMDSGLVETAEPHFTRTSHEMIPDDPDFSRQWGLTAIQAPDAWEMSLGSREVIIALIDTGVDYQHPDLHINIWTNLSESRGKPDEDDDLNGYVDDIYGWDFADHNNDPSDISGHGTHVAGIIGASTHNALDIAGVCPRIRIMPLKVTKDAGGDMDTFDIIEAIEYAMDKGAAILNLSFGGTRPQTAEESALRRFAQNNDGLIICSAGNQGIDIDHNPLYPASYDLPHVISVASSRLVSDGRYALADLSNYGRISVDLMAPGENIVSTLPGKTGILSGTSMATGFVSGAAGLLKARAPLTTARGIKTLLLDNVDPIQPAWDRHLLTNGHLNIFNALAKLPLPGDMDKSHSLEIPDNLAVLRILSGFAVPDISEEIKHWDAGGTGKAELPEAIIILQKEHFK